MSEPAPQSKKDRWAHRRAEPRTLAFAWALFILACGVMTIGLLLLRGPWALLDKGVYQYAARTMLLSVALGLCVLWPMVRLSQAVPMRERTWVAIVRDLIVLLPPLQAVVWAQAAARAGWAFDAIAAMSLSLLAWPVLLGAALATLLRPGPAAAETFDTGTVFAGTAGPNARARTLAMAAVALAALGPLLALRLGLGWAAMLSPVSAVLDLTRNHAGGAGRPTVVDGRWTALLAQGALALAWWAWLIVRGRDPQRNPQRNHERAVRRAIGHAGPDAISPIASGVAPRRRGPMPDDRGDRLSSTNAVPEPQRTQEGRPMDYMTADEKARIKARLDELVANRPRITERIAEARALGDLKENSEYHSARELQGMEEAEIRRLEDRLSNAKVVNDDLAKDAQVAFLGSLVKIREVSENGPAGKAEMVKLVGEFSDEPPEDYDEVTANSPMGSALMKARVGETVRVDAPRGVKRFEILEIL